MEKKTRENRKNEKNKIMKKLKITVSSMMLMAVSFSVITVPTFANTAAVKNNKKLDKKAKKSKLNKKKTAKRKAGKKSNIKNKKKVNIKKKKKIIKRKRNMAVLRAGDVIINQDKYLKGRNFDKAKAEYIYNALMNYEQKIDVADLGYHIDEISQDALDRSNLRVAYNFIMLEHPELIQISQKFDVTVNTGTKLITSITPTYTISQADYQPAVTKMQKEADKIVKKAQKKRGRKAKVIEADCLLRKKIKYRMSKRGISAYGALVEGKAFCMGYSRAFALCMSKLKIPCAYEQTEDHIWNRVKIGRKWLVVDVTYNDTDGVQLNLLTNTHYEPDEDNLIAAIE